MKTRVLAVIALGLFAGSAAYVYAQARALYCDFKYAQGVHGTLTLTRSDGTTYTADSCLAPGPTGASLGTGTAPVGDVGACAYCGAANKAVQKTAENQKRASPALPGCRMINYTLYCVDDQTGAPVMIDIAAARVTLVSAVPTAWTSPPANYVGSPIVAQGSIATVGPAPAPIQPLP